FSERCVGEFCAIDGEVFKRIQNRRTIRFEREGRAFFLKCHRGVGWGEILKNLVSLRLPVLGARNEWEAIRRLTELGIATTPVAAFGEEGRNPAAQRSFLMTEALLNTRDLEFWAREIGKHPDRRQRLLVKRTLINKIAKLVRKLHGNGINHRDFYLCHLRTDIDREQMFREPGRARLYVMDLHRAQIRTRTPQRWMAKDIEGLLYSSLHGPAGLQLTTTDMVRFLRVYLGREWRQRLESEKALWRLVIARFEGDYFKDHGRKPVLPVFLKGT
ncbi:MAG: lipopolysaccharide core heptose(I) kinase RfaP, partial [Gammaproteobacteria bacterium]|nr:lipopolysaccharide core heptose(I) kinase RfaP [Gammaproteobacteria bacterium]